MQGYCIVRDWKNPNLRASPFEMLGDRWIMFFPKKSDAEFYLNSQFGNKSKEYKIVEYSLRLEKD